MQQVATSQRQWRLVRQASIAGVHPQLLQVVMRHSTYIRAGGVDKDVMFADADPDLNDAIDAAYRDKYRRYGERSVAGVVNPEARAATIKLMPR